MINLHSLSRSDPRRKEIKGLAAEYKHMYRAYKELKKMEADAVKEVDHIRADLMEKTRRIESKEAKEKKSGKELKGFKKRSLEKARQKSRDLQDLYEDRSLQLKKVQTELKHSAERLNEKGNEVSTLFCIVNAIFSFLPSFMLLLQSNTRALFDIIDNSSRSYGLGGAKL